MRYRLLRLLERWAERENVRINGRGLLVPEVTHWWGFNKIGGLEIVSSGVCWEKCTATYASSDLDEFGVAFRQLQQIEQALILVDHLGDDDEWEELTKYYGISSNKASRRLRKAWKILAWKCLWRGLIQFRQSQSIPESKPSLNASR